MGIIGAGAPKEGNMKNRERVQNYLRSKTRKMTVDGTYRLTPAQTRRVKQKSGQWAKRNREEK